MRTGLCLALLSSVIACSSPPEGPTGHRDDVGAALTIQHRAVVRFQADWNTVTENLPIYAGGELQIVYDPLRLPTCRQVGVDRRPWEITAQIEVTTADGVDAVPVSLWANGREYQATWAVPEAATGLALTFVNHDSTGCVDRDEGADGAGYLFEARTPSVPGVIRLDANWGEAVEGDLVRGGFMQIAYAPGRLPVCRGRRYGGRAWNIIAAWRFSPGGQTGQAALFNGAYYDDDAAYTEPAVAIPDDAESVALWFSNSDHTGCSGWDSDFGANYTFPIGAPGAQAPSVGWAGDFEFVQFGREREPQGDVDPAYYFDRWQGAPRASWVEAQVWVPGITDQRYPNADAARAAAAGLWAAAVTDAVAAPGGAWGEVPLDFMEQRGNNFVFALRFLDLRPPHRPTPFGLYHYFFAFSTNGGLDRYTVGDEGGRTRRFVLAEALDCALFPDHAPAGCDQARAVDWAGDWGARRGGACAWRPGLEDPVTFTKSALGSDCMVLTADAYVAGLTDQGGDPGAIMAQVETDVGFNGGALAAPVTYPLRFAGREGNNARYEWSVAEHVGRADRGDYRYRVRFSADGGATWTTLGAEGGGWRTLRIRNDSLDVDPEAPAEMCDDLWRWNGPGNQFPACLPYTLDGQFDANFCEFYVNALGRGHFTQAAANERWIEAYLTVAPQQGTLLEAGLLVRYRDDDGAEQLAFVVGDEIEPNYWRTGFSYSSNAGGYDYALTDLAFFIDVQRPDGDVERLWHSNGGANYSLADAYAVPGFSLNIGSGAIEYADERVGLFDAKRRCR